MQLMCFDSKMVAVPCLLIFSKLVASLTATAMGKKKFFPIFALYTVLVSRINI